MKAVLTQCRWEYFPQHGHQMECANNDEIIVGRCGSGRNEGEDGRLDNTQIFTLKVYIYFRLSWLYLTWNFVL